MTKYDIIIPEDKDIAIKAVFIGGDLEIFKIGRNRLLIGGRQAPMVALDMTQGKVAVTVTSIQDVPEEMAFYQTPEAGTEEWMEEWRGLWNRKITGYSRRFGWDGRLTNILLGISAYGDHFFVGLGYKTRPYPLEALRHIIQGNAKIKGIGPTYLQLLEKNYLILEQEVLEYYEPTGKESDL